MWRSSSDLEPMFSPSARTHGNGQGMARETRRARGRERAGSGAVVARPDGCSAYHVVQREARPCEAAPLNHRMRCWCRRRAASGTRQDR